MANRVGLNSSEDAERYVLQMVSLLYCMHMILLLTILFTITVNQPVELALSHDLITVQFDWVCMIVVLVAAELLH